MKARNVFLGIIIVVFFSAGILSGCSSKKIAPPTIETVMKNELDGAPEWISKGCAPYLRDKKNNNSICGVGSISGTSNPSLARTAAIGRARTDMARTLQTKVMAMLKDYQATTTGGKDFGSSASDEQHVVDVSKQVTDMTLSGAEPVDSWISKTGTYYVLAVLDVDKFKDAVNNMKNLSESVRKAVVERADKAFSELDVEISKQRSGSN